MKRYLLQSAKNVLQNNFVFTTAKRYLLRLAKNDVLENNFVILQGTKIHLCQILLCSSIYNVYGCFEIQGDLMADC